jgi:hypothetical protein
MNMIYTIIITIIASVGSATLYFTQKISELDHSITQLEIDKEKLKISRPTSYGQLSKVNRVELTTTSVQQDCVAWDWEGWGQGGIEFKWEHQFAYGVSIPSDFVWDIIPDGDNKVKVIVPELKQLRPIKVEYYSYKERNEATGEQWENMLDKATPTAKAWLEAAASNKLKSDRNVIESARAAAETFLLPLINESRSKAEKSPYLSLDIVFEGEESLVVEAAQLYPDNCEDLI